MAGYSGTPLLQKIGIKPGHRIILRNHPPSFLQELGSLPESTQQTDRLTGKANVIVYFTDRRAQLEKDFPRLIESNLPDGMIWISWPKRASGKPTDLNENIVRDTGLALGVVDVKVCAIDEIWSGLKFVVRLKDRPEDRRPAAGAKSGARAIAKKARK
jgi:hypothetical protein